MLVTRNYSRVRMAARKVKEKLPGPTLIKVRCYSAGHHGRGNEPEVPAGNPLRGSTSWDIMDVDEEYDLPALEEFVGKPAQIWTGDGGGSYHERWISIFLVAPGLDTGFTGEATTPKFVGEFVFRNLKASCQELIDRLNLTGGPVSDEWPSRDVDPSLLDRKSGAPEIGGQESKQEIDVETPDKPQRGETSQQYWDRLRDEKIDKYHYRHQGD